jgi:hypothetical protein
MKKAFSLWIWRMMMKPGGYFYRESAAPQYSKLGGAGVPPPAHFWRHRYR